MDINDFTGICAFSCAWHRPDLFGLVISHCGSYVNLRGGHNFPWMVRNTAPRKPIQKVFLQSGRHDMDKPRGNWALANQTMAAALQYAGCALHHIPYLCTSHHTSFVHSLPLSSFCVFVICELKYKLDSLQMLTTTTTADNVRFEFGEGVHSLRHGGACFPETLCWLFGTTTTTTTTVAATSPKL